MHSYFIFILSLFAVAVNAHFQLQFPPPRGVFVEDDEPTFCDGYLNSVSNRTEFPLSGGFYSLNSEHPQWTAGVLISTLENPQSFNNFSQVNTYYQISGEGAFCIPLDFSTSNFTSLTSGQNVTIQIVFDGGDGQLYQCADLTLADNFNISSSVSCTNATGSTASATSTAPASSSTSSATLKYSAPFSALAVTFAAIGLALL